MTWNFESSKPNVTTAADDDRLLIGDKSGSNYATSFITPANLFGSGLDATLGDITATGDVDLSGANSVSFDSGSWTPSFQGVSVSYNSQVGRYERVGGYGTIEWEIDYTSLDTGDGSNIAIEGMPFNLANADFITGDVNYTDSTGLNLASGDYFVLATLGAVDKIRFLLAPDTLTGYNSGKINASGVFAGMARFKVA